MNIGNLCPKIFLSSICFLGPKHVPANFSHRHLAEVYVGDVITAQGSGNCTEFWENIQREVQLTDNSSRYDLSRINMNAAGIQETILGQSRDIVKVATSTLIT